MSGHSKWANIKHKKGKTDALKAKLATKIGREITVAARMGCLLYTSSPEEIAGTEAYFLPLFID